MSSVNSTSLKNISDRGKRLEIFIHALNLKKKEFAEQSGMKPSQISMFISGNSEVSEKIVSLWVNKFKLNRTWLFDGIGAMFLGEKQTLPKNLIHANHAQDILSNPIDRVKRSIEIIKALGLAKDMLGKMLADEELFLVLEDLYYDSGPDKDTKQS